MKEKIYQRGRKYNNLGWGRLPDMVMVQLPFSPKALLGVSLYLSLVGLPFKLWGGGISSVQNAM